MATIKVFCGLPQGLRLQLYNKVREPDGIEHMHPTGEPVILNGKNSATHGSFGETLVDADFWNAWLAANQDYSAVTAGLIFAESPSDAAA